MCLSIIKYQIWEKLVVDRTRPTLTQHKAYLFNSRETVKPLLTTEKIAHATDTISHNTRNNMVDNFEMGESKYGRIYKVAGPRKYYSACSFWLFSQWSSRRTCQAPKCTSSSRSVGTNWSARSSSSKVIPPPFSATRTLVSDWPKGAFVVCRQ